MNGGLNALVGANATIHSQSFAGVENRPDQNIPGYATFDLRVGIESVDGWSLTAWARNVTNKFYLTGINNWNDGLVRYTGEPRNFGVTAAYKF